MVPAVCCQTTLLIVPSSSLAVAISSMVWPLVNSLGMSAIDKVGILFELTVGVSSPPEPPQALSNKAQLANKTDL